MKEIVSKILKEEETTRRKVEEAERQAGDIVEMSRKQGEELIEEALTAARETARKRGEESEKEFLAEKDALLAEARKNAAALRQEKQKDIESLSAQTFARIIEIKS